TDDDVKLSSSSQWQYAHIFWLEDGSRELAEGTQLHLMRRGAVLRDEAQKKELGKNFEGRFGDQLAPMAGALPKGAKGAGAVPDFAKPNDKNKDSSKPGSSDSAGGTAPV